jgi:hypothetical protein
MLSARMASARARAAGVALMILIVTVGEATAQPAQQAPAGPASPGAPGAREPIPPTDPLYRAPAPATIPSAQAPGYRLFDLPTRPGATFELLYSLGVTEEYTDNFNLSKTDKESNFRTVISPGATLLINGARTRGRLSFTPSFSYDSSNDDTNLFLAFSGTVVWEATPFFTLTAADTLSLSDDYLTAGTLSLRREREKFISNVFSLYGDYRRDTLSVSPYYVLSTFFDEGGEDTGGEDTVTHSVGVTLSKRFLIRNTGTVGYEYLYSDTSDDGEDVSGHQVTLSLAHQLNVETAVGLSGSYAHRWVSGGGLPGSDEYYIVTVSVFGSYIVRGIWSASASTGYTWLKAIDVSPRVPTDSESLPFVSAQVSYFALPRTVLTLSGFSGFSESFSRGENFGVVETYGVTGTVSYAVTPLVGAFASAFWNVSQETGVAGGVRGDPEETYGVNAGLSYQALRWLSLGLTYTHTRALGDDGFTENRVTATATASF